MALLDLWRGDRSLRPMNWGPFSQDFDSMFEDFERAFGAPLSWRSKGTNYVPACDMDETENEYHLVMDVPGLDKDDIRIDVIGNSVSISGERQQEEESSEKNRHRIERNYGKFLRTFTLPEGIKDDEVEASYDNGVLSLRLPKSEVSKTKHVSIKSGKPLFAAKISSKETRGKGADTKAAK